MSIRETLIKIKGLAEALENRDIFAAILIFLVGISSFFLGKLSAREDVDVPVVITEAPLPEVRGASASVPETQAKALRSEANKPSEPASAEQGMYVGSKNGTKFHLPWCSGAKRIAEANKIWFATKEEAIAKGYAPAANCKGI